MFGDGTCSLNYQMFRVLRGQSEQCSSSHIRLPLDLLFLLSGGFGLKTARSLHGCVNTSPTCVFLSMAASRISLWKIAVFKDGHHVPHTLVAP